VKTCLVIFDGSNFFHSAKKLFPATHLTYFNYRHFAEQITSSPNIKILYCVGEIRQEKTSSKSKTLYAKQQALFYNLSKQRIDLYKGYMLKNSGKYHEKGVDVFISVTIVKGALKNEYSDCYLISSDTDLIPAIKEARSVGKKVHYISFKNSISRALSKNCDSTIVISNL
jgi:uncharacterized LabA/DUF88 family protein